MRDEKRPMGTLSWTSMKDRRDLLDQIIKEEACFDRPSVKLFRVKMQVTYDLVVDGRDEDTAKQRVKRSIRQGNLFSVLDGQKPISTYFKNIKPVISVGDLPETATANNILWSPENEHEALEEIPIPALMSPPVLELDDTVYWVRERLGDEGLMVSNQQVKEYVKRYVLLNAVPYR